MKFFLSLTFLLTTFLIHAQRDTLFYTYNNIPVASFSECRTYGVLKYVSPDSVQVIETKFRKSGMVLSRTLYLDFENKVRHGQQMFWNDSMRLALTKDYYKDTLQGYVKHYSRSGQLESEQAYIEGVLVHDTVYIEKDSMKRIINGIDECMPIFPGCEGILNDEERQQCSSDALFSAVISNVKYPPEARDRGVQGTVIIKFIIKENGKLAEIKVLQGITDGESLEKEAIKAVLNLPKMISGTQRGEEVRVQYVIPVKFRLDAGKYQWVDAVYRPSPLEKREREEKELKGQGADRKPIWSGCHLKGIRETEDDCTEWRMRRYVQKNIVYPESLKKDRVKAIVKVYFTVTKEGEVTKVTVLGNVKNYPKMQEEAKRVVQSMPKFIPAKKEGNPVPFQLSVAIKFKY